VQGLLVQLIEHDFVEKLDPARGRLRGYLKRALQHYLVNLHEHEFAAKRGGGRVPSCRASGSPASRMRGRRRCPAE